jgi:hypothetical protein
MVSSSMTDRFQFVHATYWVGDRSNGVTSNSARSGVPPFRETWHRNWHRTARYEAVFSGTVACRDNRKVGKIGLSGTMRDTQGRHDADYKTAGQTSEMSKAQRMYLCRT